MSDRRFAIVIGIDLDNPKGLRRLVKLDLLTGANEEIATDVAPGWTPLLAKVSPDNRWLIGQYAQQTRASSDFQMNLIDLTSGKARQLGKTGHFGGALSWLPDREAAIARRFQPASEPSMICRLGTDGTQKDIRVGDEPLVLRKSKKILYRDGGSAIWYTCNLDGTDPLLYADGMKACWNPAISPDGGRIIFDCGGDGKATTPKLFEFGKTNGIPITSAKGFTGHTVW